ncbi:MAG: hypothetical protein LC792_20735, partial [Actinobacteria bacterium]|nr:hypothetical protein [Actinomycetota bacterium]
MKDPGFFLPARRRLHRSEGGFALIETAAAMGIVFLALMMLSMAMLVGLTDSAAARQREIATGIADKLVEQARGISYTTLANGLADSDLVGDANIVNCSGTYRYKTCAGESIVHFNGTPPAPLYPHQGTFGSSAGYSNVYSSSLYVTQATGVPTAGALRVTVAVTWTASARSTSSSFQVQTLIYQAQGTGNANTRTSSAANTFFLGNGAASSGKVVVTPGSGVANGIAGLSSWDSMAVASPALDADVSSEDLTSVNAQTTLTATKKTISGAETVSGGTKAASAADNDPTNTTPALDQPAAPSQSPPSVSVSGGGNSLTAAAVAAGSGGGACPGAKSVGLVDGFESGTMLGYTTTASPGGSVAADNTAGVARTGSYALKIAKVNGSSDIASTSGAFTNRRMYSFAFKFASLPSADVQMIFSSAATLYLRLGYQQSSNRFTLSWLGQTVATSSMTVTAGRWYHFDILADTSANPNVAAWAIDGQTQTPPANYATAANNQVPTFTLGSSAGTDVYTGWFDDFVFDNGFNTTSTADYPLGDYKVLTSTPDSMGTGAGTSVWKDQAGATYNSNFYQRINEAPLDVSNSTYIYPTATGTQTTNYLDVNFADTTETCIAGVTPFLSYYNGSSNKTSNLGVSPYISGAFAQGSAGPGDFTALTTKVAIGQVWPAVGTYSWTQAQFNALSFHVWSGDVTPQPNFEGVLLQYAVPNTGPATPGNETGSTVSTTSALSAYGCGSPIIQNDAKPCAFATDNYS